MIETQAIVEEHHLRPEWLVANILNGEYSGLRYVIDDTESQKLLKKHTYGDRITVRFDPQDQFCKVVYK
jgi:hypothetical protein